MIEKEARQGYRETAVIPYQIVTHPPTALHLNMDFQRYRRQDNVIAFLMLIVEPQTEEHILLPMLLDIFPVSLRYGEFRTLAWRGKPIAISLHREWNNPTTFLQCFSAVQAHIMRDISLYALIPGEEAKTVLWSEPYQADTLFTPEELARWISPISESKDAQAEK